AVGEDIVEHGAVGLGGGRGAGGTGAGAALAAYPRTSRQRYLPRLAQSRRQPTGALSQPPVPAISPWPAGRMERGLWRELDVGVVLSPHGEEARSAVSRTMLRIAARTMKARLLHPGLL